ncbi:MAG TPA: helix-turn-helix domain-containing protein, partial [Chloroflexota bacterium]|nr:helix-turn-helix domain-containing protein [Chloroflexota bacterium]
MAGDVLTSQSLRARRLALGLSQAALGSLLGVSANTVARWERGALRIGSADLVRLALERLEAAPA